MEQYAMINWNLQIDGLADNLFSSVDGSSWSSLLFVGELNSPACLSQVLLPALSLLVHLLTRIPDEL